MTKADWVISRQIRLPGKGWTFSDGGKRKSGISPVAA